MTPAHWPFQKILAHYRLNMVTRPCSVLLKLRHKGLTSWSEESISYITSTDCTKFKATGGQVGMPALASRVKLSCQIAATCHTCITLLGCTWICNSKHRHWLLQCSRITLKQSVLKRSSYFFLSWEYGDQTWRTKSQKFRAISKDEDQNSPSENHETIWKKGLLFCDRIQLENIW